MTDAERMEAAHVRLGHPSHRWTKVNTVLILGIILFTILRELQYGAAVEEEKGVREAVVSYAVTVQRECENPEIAKMAPDVCAQAEEILEDPENAEAVTVGAPAGRDATDEQVRTAVAERLPFFLQDLLPPQIPPAINNYFQTHPINVPESLSEDEARTLIADLMPTADEVAALIPPPEDGQDGADSTIPGPAGPTCPNGATPVRIFFKGTASISAPKGEYLWCPAG